VFSAAGAEHRNKYLKTSNTLTKLEVPYFWYFGYVAGYGRQGGKSIRLNQLNEGATARLGEFYEYGVKNDVALHIANTNSQQ
jgi:hypothetical protein